MNNFAKFLKFTYRVVCSLVCCHSRMEAFYNKSEKVIDNCGVRTIDLYILTKFDRGQANSERGDWAFEFGNCWHIASSCTVPVRFINIFEPLGYSIETSHV